MTTLTATLEESADGHSFLSGLTVMWVFGLAGLFVFGLAFEAALNHFFG